MTPSNQLEDLGKRYSPKVQRGSEQSPGCSCILLHCMLVKRVVCNISGSLVSIAMSRKMKVNPGSGRIWNLIMGVFRGGPPSALPLIVQEIFQRLYILWRQQWTATAAEQRPDTATSAFSSCSSLKFPNVYRLLTIL